MATRQSGRACYLGSTMMKRKRVQSGRGQREAGFSLIEVLFATVILMVGLLAMLATFAYALATTLNHDGTHNPNLKQVTVNVQYIRPGQRVPRTYTVNALMSVFR